MGWTEQIPTLSMIACQFMYAAVILIGKKALSQDMSSMAFVVYRQCVAFLLLAPFVFTSVTLFQNLYFEGLNLASSSAASAMNNLVPSITLITAYTIGLEKLNLPSVRSVAKIIGTVLCVSGAVAIALLKGPKLLNDEIQDIRDTFLLGVPNQWLLGCLFLFGGACAWSL
ncbi:WAT1-related protein [Sesamum alatum]|uniref:WAT1-related protein n=1 Tax=Sesamum alatum TaxID=300844 RepID=A0AAE1Y7D3_9LAMI|nr:WAT1-related protein [Sesamum alatum]